MPEIKSGADQSGGAGQQGINKAEIVEEMELKLQAITDLSFALRNGDFVAALELAKKLNESQIFRNKITGGGWGG